MVADFPQYTAQELDDHGTPTNDTMKESRPRAAATFDDWVRRARGGAAVFTFVYGLEWKGAPQPPHRADGQLLCSIGRAFP